jgi:hypothetical protein
MYTRIQNNPWIKWGIAATALAAGAFFATRALRTRHQPNRVEQTRRWINHRLPWKKNGSLIHHIPLIDRLPWFQSRTPMGRARRLTHRLSKLV